MTIPRLRELMKTVSPDIIFLMETKNHDDFVLSHFVSTDYIHHFTIPPNGLSRGLALLWKKEVELTILSSSPHFIDAKITYKNLIFYTSFIYGEPNQANRASFWDHISEIGVGRDPAWLLSGDFMIY